MDNIREAVELLRTKEPLLSDRAKAIELVCDVASKCSDLYFCTCGVVLNLEQIHKYQYNSNKFRQEYRCPICEEDIDE